MWPYYLLVFLSSVGIMTVELVAGRLIAPSLGVNLYTWTSVIGVVLAGMSGGYFVGGFLADRSNPRRLLGPVLIGAGLTTAAIVPLLIPVLEGGFYRQLPPVLGVLAPVVLLFFVPAFCLALVSPIVYKLALRDLSQTGAIVGRLAAANALGSIVGTFATGFWLVPAIGSRTIVLGVSVVMVALGVIFASWRPGPRVAALVVVVGVGAALFMQPPTFLRSPCLVESAYYCLRITWATDSQAGNVKQLVLDHLIHSGANLQDPNFLWYDYEKVMAWILKGWAGPGVRTFFMGGGGYTLPHWVDKNLSGAKVEVAEIDPAVTRIALEEFIPADTPIVTHNVDARQALLRLPGEQRYDVIIGDAFNDISIPYHLTTLEFSRLLRQRLSDNGLYLANVIDRPDGPFLGAYARTLAEVFPHVYIVPGGAAAAFPNRPSTMVVAASLQPLPWEQWRPQATVPFSVQERPVDRRHRVLTDDYAPVDNMLLPIFAYRWGS